MEELLGHIMEGAVNRKLIANNELARMIVDSTVQEKTIAHPSKSKLLEMARVKVVDAAKANGVGLKIPIPKKANCWTTRLGSRPCPSI